MINLKYTGLGLIVLAGIGVGTLSVSADSAKVSLSTSDIPKATLQSDRLEAEANALNISTTLLKQDRTNKTLKTVISNTGLSKKAYLNQVNTKITSELSSQGYSQDQINNALGHHHKIHQKHHTSKS
jgi:hypothetical protein